MMLKVTARVLLFLNIILFCSCDESRVFDSYKSIENGLWKRHEPVQFEFEILDTIHKHNLFFSIRNNQKYEFSNLFLISEMNFPNGKKIVDTLEYEMADSRGKFLGNGMSTNIENKLFYKEGNIFPRTGIYSISITQAMRRSGDVQGIQELLGITDVGFRIEKAQ